MGDILLMEQTVKLTQCSPVRGNRLSVYTSLLYFIFLLEFDFGFERIVCFYCISLSLFDLIGNNLSKKLKVPGPYSIFGGAFTVQKFILNTD